MPCGAVGFTGSVGPDQTDTRNVRRSLPPAATVRDVTKEPTALGQMGLALFFFGFCGLGFGWFGVRDIANWEYHPRGTVVVRECHSKGRDSKSGITTYECFGDYTSDAGDLHMGVWFTDEGNHKLGDTVRATVSGPDGGEAELFDPVQAGIFLFMAAGGTGVGLILTVHAIVLWWARPAPGARAGHLTARTTATWPAAPPHSG